MTQIDTVATHRYPFCNQERPLPPALREAPGGADDTMPWEVVVDGRQDEPDEARRAWIDVAVGADKPNWDGAHAADDAGGSLLGGGQATHLYIQFPVDGARKMDLTHA